MLGQSLAREFHPKGIHVVHVILNGQSIRPPKLSRPRSNRATETIISPDSIADMVLFTLKQTPDAWTDELDLRPHLESF
jgi:hypothetical protein